MTSDYIYIKLFKNMPRSDVEMIFPNTKVRFRLFDKLKFGVTAGSGVGMGVFGTVGKIAIASNPYTLAAAVAGLGGVALRQATAFINQRTRYMVVLAQNLYFHAMADNRGVMTLLADRAAEEDIKEEMLLYGVLAKERVNVRDLRQVDEAIEEYLKATFGIEVNFDVDDALQRLKAEGIVNELPDGTLETLPPREAALHIDKLWDACLDNLPDIVRRGGPGDRRRWRSRVRALTRHAARKTSRTAIDVPDLRATGRRAELGRAHRASARVDGQVRSSMRCWSRAPTSTRASTSRRRPSGSNG